jgi:peptidoglycan/LPS O-acetylase OafA/YrhL
VPLKDIYEEVYSDDGEQQPSTTGSLTGTRSIKTLMKTNNKFFRGDIEGMRAVAILLVISAHFAIPGFSAGFIGVDIFFVLSGFLITGILVREYQQEGRINLVRFYANRFRRLFPALATMLIISCVAASWILPDTQNLLHSKAAAMAAVWLSNIHFTFADVDYFAAESSTNLFVHTWSLGVEEQFYLLWPLLILVAMALPAVRGKPSLPIWLVLLAVFIASLIACILLSSTQTVFAFYMMPTRAWQFAAGGAAWLLSQNMPATTAGARLGGIIASLLLAAAMLCISSTSTYPGLLALLPTLATCALLWAGSASNAPNQALLSMPFMQWVGRLSYAWYLWHWPVLILGEHLLPVRGDFTNTLGAITLSLLLALITHHVIENPIRFGKTREVKPSWQISTALALMILLNSQMLRWYTETGEQFSKNQPNQYTQAKSDLPFFYNDGCDDWYRSDELKPCFYGSAGATKTVVLLGDSIGVQWFPALTQMYHSSEWTLIVLTKSGCSIVDEPFFHPRLNREFTECGSWRNKAIEWIIQQKPDTVFMGNSAATHRFTDEQLVNGTRRILGRLSPAAEILYLIEANPVLKFNGPDCLIKHHKTSPEKCTADRANEVEHLHIASLLKSITTNYENVHWLETASFVCPTGQCSAEKDELVIYRDHAHLTAKFTATATGHFFKQIKGRSE